MLSRVRPVRRRPSRPKCALTSKNDGTEEISRTARGVRPISPVPLSVQLSSAGGHAGHVRTPHVATRRPCLGGTAKTDSDCAPTDFAPTCSFNRGLRQVASARTSRQWKDSRARSAIGLTTQRRSRSASTRRGCPCASGLSRGQGDEHRDRRDGGSGSHLDQVEPISRQWNYSRARLGNNKRGSGGTRIPSSRHPSPIGIQLNWQGPSEMTEARLPS
jgi:hypothetical protein